MIMIIFIVFIIIILYHDDCEYVHNHYGHPCTDYIDKYFSFFFSLAGQSQIWCGLWDDAARRTRRISPMFLWGPGKQEWGGVQQKLSDQYQSRTEQALDIPSIAFANKFDAWQDIPECKPGV